MNLDTRYRILKIIQEQPQISQRDLARIMGISLGKANYCLQALVKVGMVKIKNFRNSHNKSAYLYKLTPRGIEEKAQVTQAFLKRKLAEYEIIRQEIAELKADVAACEEEQF
ncbi:MAG: MarR family EPS-associated transcriptional regulator [Desulfobulbaceae bacterium]|nr:MAG: MarR family EPS-associated transcriptional regulator [Desulfobulbaceae bacterium]